jgi:hypothetical protein
MEINADILADIERFCAANGVPETTFGRRATSDPNLIAGLRGGRELRRSTELRVRTFMEEHGASNGEANGLRGGAEGVGVHAHRMTENGAHHHVR